MLRLRLPYVVVAESHMSRVGHVSKMHSNMFSLLSQHEGTGGEKMYAITDTASTRGTSLMMSLGRRVLSTFYMC